MTTPPPPPPPAVDTLTDAAPEAPPYTLALYSLLIILDDTAHLSEDGRAFPAITALQQIGTPPLLIAHLWYNVELVTDDPTDHTPEK